MISSDHISGIKVAASVTAVLPAAPGYVAVAISQSPIVFSFVVHLRFVDGLQRGNTMTIHNYPSRSFDTSDLLKDIKESYGHLSIKHLNDLLGGIIKLINIKDYQLRLKFGHLTQEELSYKAEELGLLILEKEIYERKQND